MYWEYHYMLYENQGQDGWASHDNLVMYAADMGLHTESFESCLAQDHSERISFGMQQARGLGIDQTPSFVIVGPGGVQTILGNQPYPAFEAAVQSLLGG